MFYVLLHRVDELSLVLLNRTMNLARNFSDVDPIHQTQRTPLAKQKGY